MKNLIARFAGSYNAWWHNGRDTLDKLSADSFAIVGMVVPETSRAPEQ